MDEFKKNTPIYIIDFLNIFSDFREIKYKKENVDFHSTKHLNKEQDTYDFFKLFFTKYIQYVGLKRNSPFIFIMKKLNEYEKILNDILIKYSQYDISFLIIEDKYNNDILDKNKDDFLCQYIFYTFRKNNECILISNDKYRDRHNYIKLFDFDMIISLLKYNNNNKKIDKINKTFTMNKNIQNNLLKQIFTRCSIPKNKLNNII
jgi:hypothetical protein